MLRERRAFLLTLAGSLVALGLRGYMTRARTRGMISRPIASIVSR